jgi:peptidylprolyl isomerase
VRRGRSVPAALAAAVLALVVGACGSPEAPGADPDITVTGDPGGTPTLTYVTPLVVGHTYRRVVWPGTGPLLPEGGPLLLRFWVEDGTTARVVTENYSATPVPQVLARGDLGDALYETLSGQRVGARLLQVTPPGDEAEEGYPAVTVIDVLPTRAMGEDVQPREDLPAVTLAENGAPSLTATQTAPPEDLTIQALIRGSGRQIEANDVVTVQYAGFSWATGEAFDSTWDRGQPTSFALSDVPALAEGLVEQTTGSQVMLVVPPSYDLGATHSEALAGQTVVLVIDVLASGPQGVNR